MKPEPIKTTDTHINPHCPNCNGSGGTISLLQSSILPKAIFFQILKCNCPEPQYSHIVDTDESIKKWAKQFAEKKEWIKQLDEIHIQDDFFIKNYIGNEYPNEYEYIKHRKRIRLQRNTSITSI